MEFIFASCLAVGVVSVLFAIFDVGRQMERKNRLIQHEKAIRRYKEAFKEVISTLNTTVEKREEERFLQKTLSEQEKAGLRSTVFCLSNKIDEMTRELKVASEERDSLKKIYADMMNALGVKQKEDNGSILLKIYPPNPFDQIISKQFDEAEDAVDEIMRLGLSNARYVLIDEREDKSPELEPMVESSGFSLITNVIRVSKDEQRNEP